jgi:hypothetical protein
LGGGPAGEAAYSLSGGLMEKVLLEDRRMCRVNGCEFTTSKWYRRRVKKMRNRWFRVSAKKQIKEQIEEIP